MKAGRIFLLLLLIAWNRHDTGKSWIRINQIGYTIHARKIAVWCSKDQPLPVQWMVVDAASGNPVFSSNRILRFGAYGPFTATARLDFSSITRPGTYYVRAGVARSPVFRIGDSIYDGTADYCLRYMRQQRSGFNPFLKDSCHTRDGYSLYGKAAGIPDSSHIDATGGWHDASDYLQYAATSANAAYHLLMAYRDFPGAFGDNKKANGLDGSNDIPDVLDEAKWGLDWLLKMHPQADWMFNQLGDDRDHQGMRIPREDSFYGKGIERPVYFISGEPQQRGKFMNATTGTSSTAAKFAAAFALGATSFQHLNGSFADTLLKKSATALRFALKKPGVTQTVSVRSPYIYAEENWTDDMELATTAYYTAHHKRLILAGKNGDDSLLATAMAYARAEPLTPWLGADTAKHYQWYPFINLGHDELAKEMKGAQRDSLLQYYKEGIERVWKKAEGNAFYRGIPFIWCSNNLTTSFAIQCYWYRSLSGDRSYEELEQASFDWLFGCNPWGTSMVYGLPADGDTPIDPHSAFTHIGHYPIDGALVDGPVYTSIYESLIGITLYDTDEYAAFQSPLAVYHDDYGDYSTNEPTMDGTASLVYLLASKSSNRGLSIDHGAIIRADSARKRLALVFTGDGFADGGDYITDLLNREKIKASFFFTGRFYANPAFAPIIRRLKKGGHYLGAHSDQHLLYCDWDKRDSLLVTKQQFMSDLLRNYGRMERAGIRKLDAPYFLPPYEWFNDSIAAWTRSAGLQLVNFSPGTGSNADYTTPADANYRSSDSILHSILNYGGSKPSGLNGFILLMHVGTDPLRKDKFYWKLPALIAYLRRQGYDFQTITGLFDP